MFVLRAVSYLRGHRSRRRHDESIMRGRHKFLVSLFTLKLRKIFRMGKVFWDPRYKSLKYMNAFIRMRLDVTSHNACKCGTSINIIVLNLHAKEEACKCIALFIHRDFDFEDLCGRLRLILICNTWKIKLNSRLETSIWLSLYEKKNGFGGERLLFHRTLSLSFIIERKDWKIYLLNAKSFAWMLVTWT